ncbi:uncharacterized protein MEPE_01011 [Melanopsichium pennsylvanicum]|uniref:Formin GTPase-binding domain-containing protein n=2 Tax=Melanopsichium pennsylvanicum TaxID=63383 RepID=A0AAJ5C373_9BASI|nr:conserved hypothetical protein [Melanopsichium pennsylvanicum 4]SNX82305.1 uncharacterized protein MEPE_01011 [Melanopsichium pennsylvanicum]
MAAVTSIRPGQYSRQNPSFTSATNPKNGKENEPIQHHERGRSSVAALSAQPIPIDPKYRLRGNSPEDDQRASRSKLSSSLSPKKGLRSRSRSRSRLFGKDKTDLLNSQAVPQPYAATRSPEQIDADFLSLLDELQVQPDLRKKLLQLTSTVKASMLQGQATLSLAAFGLDDPLSSSPTKTSRMPIPELLVKSKPASRPASAIYPTSPLLDPGHDDNAELMEPPNTAQLFGDGPPRQVSSSSIDSSSSGSAKIASRSVIREAFKKSTPNLGQGGSSVSLATSTAFNSTARPRSMSFGKELASTFGKETPESFATLLKSTDASRIDVARVKRMRAVLAAESPLWISTFIGAECAGYTAMLTRLDELLAMEWREEQHDDQLLHELLRCFVALSTTEVGRAALASQAPRPFRQLIDLLFSEKKPGDLSTRKLITELLAILLDLQLAADQSHSHSSLNYLLTLLRNPSDPAKESVVEFIKQTHTPRPFKTYILELSGVCRDYFWIFCHSQNHFWLLCELQDRIETITGPKVPGGMTGGVEFEAMAYLTVHLRLINSLSEKLVQVKPHQLPKPQMGAKEFHENLFASGIERVLATLRRASQHYYPTTHLELARYLALAQQAGYRLPYHLTDWLESPKHNSAPLLPPLELPYIASSSHLAPAVQTGGASSGYGLAGAFITPSAPIRGSSFDNHNPTAIEVSTAESHVGVSTMSRKNAIRAPCQSPARSDQTRKSPSLQPEAPNSASSTLKRPDDQGQEFWDFTTVGDDHDTRQQPRRQVETVMFDHHRLDSQFSLTEAPVGMPSSSTSKRILGLNQAVSQNLTETPQLLEHNIKLGLSGGAGESGKEVGSIVGSAVKKWESMSVSRSYNDNGQQKGGKPFSGLR